MHDDDRLSVAVLQTVHGFHNAHDKAVRLAVVTSIECVLKTVDPGNTSEARQVLYQTLAELLKVRVHDRCPQVREKAVAAVSAFQTGKKDCDVTQQLVALLCTDTHAEVRRSILQCVAPRKEFL
uniref:Condensin complex subunit 3 n=1 Tax=Lygus hesperus TaxID=30085 RepID=A0A0A9Y7N0_LYGHE